MMSYMAKTVAFASVLAVSAFCQWTAFAQPSAAREPVAILAFESVGASAAEVSSIADRLQDLLLRTKKFQVVDRARIESVLKEQAFQQTGCTSTECAVQVGKLLGVHKLITGKLTKLDDTHWVISAALIDVESGETLKAPSMPHEGRFFDFLQNGVPTLADRLASDIQPAASAPTPEPTAKPTPEPSPTAKAEEDHKGPKTGLSVSLGSGSTSAAATLVGGATAKYTIQGVGFGVDYQWALAEVASLGLFVRGLSGSVKGDAAPSYDQGTSTGVGTELRLWIGQAFVGGLLEIAANTLTDSRGLTPNTSAGGGGVGAVAGYEGVSGFYLLASVVSTSLSGKVTSATASTSYTTKESITFLMLGYRF